MTTTRQHLKLCIQVLFQYVRFYQIAEEICDYQRNGLGYTKMGLTETSLISVLNIAQSMNKLLLQRDKQVVLIGGQTGCPYWGTNKLPLLGDKQVDLIGGQTGCHYWGTNRLPLLGDK